MVDLKLFSTLKKNADNYDVTTDGKLSIFKMDISRQLLIQVSDNDKLLKIYNNRDRKWHEFNDLTNEAIFEIFKNCGTEIANFNDVTNKIILDLFKNVN